MEITKAITFCILLVSIGTGVAGAPIDERGVAHDWVDTEIATTPTTIPETSYEQARSYYIFAADEWSQAWNSKAIDQIRYHLGQAKTRYSDCLNTANTVDDPANAANVALLKSVSSAYIALADAALAMYDGADLFSTGRSLMSDGHYGTSAERFQGAADKFTTSQALFNQATATLQSVSYAGTEYGDGTVYTATIVPILNGKADYMREFATYARGWQHTGLAYHASANGNSATVQSEVAQAMSHFAGLRSSASFGWDATTNYNTLATFLGGTPTIPAQRTRFTIGIDGAYPPYTSQERDGAFVGFDIDSARWIADRMGFDVEFQAVAWDGIIPALQAGRVDMIYSGMTITEERKQQVAFTKPYLKINQAIVVRSDSDLTFDDIMSGTVIIGTQRGTTGEMWVQNNLIATGRMPASNLRSFLNFPLAITALFNYQVDATIYDKPPSVNIIEGQNAKIIHEIDTSEEYGIAIRKDDTDLLVTMNHGLDLLMADPYWDELKAKYGLTGV